MVELETKVRQYMSEYRFNHTLSVVNECKALAEMFGVKGDDLVISAYLHDITKEMPIDEQLELCYAYGITLDNCTLHSPKTLHSYSAPALIAKDFPEYNKPEIITPIRYHTTGRADMTLNEKLLYLADYIDESRSFDSCVLLRRYFFGAFPELMSREEREELLRQTLIMSYDMTIKDLLADGRPVARDTVAARNELILSART